MACFFAAELPGPAHYIVDAISLGAIYALIAVGYTMVYGIIKLINFAHGEVFMISVYTLLTLLNDPASATNRLGDTTQGKYITLAAFFGATTFIAGYTVLRNRLPLPGLLALCAALGAGSGLLFHMGATAHTNFWLAFPFTMFLMATLGISLDTVAYKPLRNASRLAPLITAIGASIILLNSAILMWGSINRNFKDVGVPEFLSSQNELMGCLPQQDLVVIVVMLLTMGVLFYLVNCTKLGKAMRAVSLDITTSRLMGVDVDKVIAATFALGAVIAAIGGFLYTGRFDVQPTHSLPVGVIAFASAVLGGIGSIPGAVLGGFLIGFAIQVVFYFDAMAGSLWDVNLNLTRWRGGIAYVVLILFLLVRPQGILGKKSVDRA